MSGDPRVVVRVRVNLSFLYPHYTPITKPKPAALQSFCASVLDIHNSAAEVEVALPACDSSCTDTFLERERGQDSGLL